jgi:hypothetical protein
MFHNFEKGITEGLVCIVVGFMSASQIGAGETSLEAPRLGKMLDRVHKCSVTGGRDRPS